jgi:hypothetical protein
MLNLTHEPVVREYIKAVADSVAESRASGTDAEPVTARY